jgi:hypothetical protein
MRSNLLHRATAALIGASLLLGACGDDDDTTATADEPTEAPVATADAPTDEPTEEPTAAPPAAPSEEPSEAPTDQPTEAPTDEPTEAPTAEVGNRIELEFAGGEVIGGVERVPVAVGTEVTIVVTSDVADELHLHGYDLYADLAPGIPAELTFVAEIPGVFEGELEVLGVPVVEVEVS